MYHYILHKFNIKLELFNVFLFNEMHKSVFYL